MERESRLPVDLVPRTGPIPEGLAEGAVASLGAEAHAVRALVAEGFVPPDVLAGMTLFLLSGQPRRERTPDAPRGGALAGGVWVREQVTLHRPVRLDEDVRVTGESARRFVRRGRRYGVTTSRTYASDGALLVTSCTTGLLRYRKDPDLPDSEEGRKEDEVARPELDRTTASDNPALDALRGLRVGDRFEGRKSVVTLELMRARDGGQSRNPIHTDPEVARREGLSAAIAGGTHVLAFLNEVLMRAWGPRALLFGARFDVRWIGQTPAGGTVQPSATVTSVASRTAHLDLSVTCDGAPALVGELRIPLA